MNDLIIPLLQNAPWLPWAWLFATLAATFVRAAFPHESDRPRWLVGLLAVLDLAQFNPSGPVKLLVQKKAGE